jgi:hypothetical protein
MCIGGSFIDAALVRTKRQQKRLDLPSHEY